jgi:ABC-type antimicrobial peptide transport system permease subunit
MTKLIAAFFGIAVGIIIFGSVLGITVSSLIVAALALVVLVRREWVPVVYNVRSLTVRKVTTAVTAGGLALVTCVFAIVLMLNSGIKRTMVATGDPQNAKIIRKGSVTEIQSGVQPDHLRILSGAPEVAMGRDGQPLAASELVVLIFALQEGATDETQGTNLNVRGVGPRGLELHSPGNLDGRTFKAGTSEIVIGKALVGRFQGATLGGTMKFARRDWTVVGVANHGGTAYDSEIWGDVDQMMDAFARRPAFSSITLRMKDSAALAALTTRMASDPQLNTLEIKTEPDYWEAQSKQFSLFITVLGIFVAVVCAFGAIIGAMITMYAQVAARTREIGTLRAIGFHRRAVLVSFVLESMLLSLVSGGIGVAVASVFSRFKLTTMNWQTFSEMTFRFDLTPGIAIASFVFAALMGYAGGLLPAVRAARMPIVQATRGG